MSALADSGLLIAAVNRGDRHHEWAVRQILAARKARQRVVVPELAVGEAFTKLRYDRRVSPRRDATAALTVFGLVDENSDLFDLRQVPTDGYTRARDVLSHYVDQSFSFVDAVIFVTVDGDRAIHRVLTVDGRDFSIYRFAHPVRVVTP